uniref:Probable chorismate pyruvate-lyase n=1 Tax=uncultured beta proteobacterium TaxID=86027 RepID=Q2Z0B6_9PROT|nr:4-hydroxybenzoate synthetase [uncultured beta proteobacterium]
MQRATGLYNRSPITTWHATRSRRQLWHNAGFPQQRLHTVSDTQRGWLSRPPALPRSLRRWLCDRGSLTRRLKARCARFSVTPLTTGLARANFDEMVLVGLSGRQLAYVRDVTLRCDDQVVVFAHSVLTRKSLRSAWNGITRLGSRPLGEALFNNPRIRRQALAYRKLRPHHPLFRRINLHLPQTERCLWARRSVFCLAGHPLLVTEVFLPSITPL